MQADGSVEIDLGPVSEGDNDGSMGDFGDGLLDEVDSEGMEDEENLPAFDEDGPLPPHIIEDMHSRNEYREGGPLPPHIIEIDGHLPPHVIEEMHSMNEYQEGGPLPPHIIEMPGLISDEDEMDSVRGDNSEDEENLPALEMPGLISDFRQ